MQEDTGNFVYALTKLKPGLHVMAAGTWCSWSDYNRIYAEVRGLKPGKFVQLGLEEQAQLAPDYAFGREVAEMFKYNSHPGYDGGDASEFPVLKLDDILKVSYHCRARFFFGYLVGNLRPSSSPSPCAIE